MKVCTGCKISKPDEAFSVHKGFKDGRNSRCKSCKSTQQKAGYKSGQYARVPYSYKQQLRGYGLTVEQYDKMVAACGGLCQICGSSGKLNVDHCHTSGAVRGLLCTKCNTGLGKLGDTKEKLLAALRYLDGEPTGS